MNKFVVFLLIYLISLTNIFANESANVNGKDFISESALHDAVRSKSLDMIEFLMGKGVQINVEDEFGYTPLHLAVRYQDENITNYLIENGANVNTLDDFGDTPLIDAVRNNNANIAKKLICKKATRDVMDRHGMSTLHYATKNNNLLLAKILTVEYIELFCQDELKISINKIDLGTNPEFCGKIDIGYVSNMSLKLVNDEEQEFGPYNVDFDNNTHKWCSKLKGELPKSIYTVYASANDYVVNEVTVKVQSGEKPTEFKVMIDKYNEPINSLTPNICGTIKDEDALKVDLSILNNGEEDVLKTYSADIDNENKTWCVKVEDRLEEGTYQLKAQGVDKNNNTSEATGEIELSSPLTIDIDPIPMYNDNTPEICGRVLRGDIAKIDLRLRSSLGEESNTFEGTINTENQTWCVNVTDEIENGIYEIIANGYDIDRVKATDIDKTKIYLITGLYEALKEEFKDDFSKWNAELDKDTLTFRFKDPTLLFNPGRSNINEKFETILSDFFPRYVKIVEEYKDEIQSVRVEGHSSSEHSRARNDTERYELNRQLSQERAQAVMVYAKAIDNEYVTNNIEWISSSFKPIGMSYSRLIYNLDGSENKELSRRVEFRILTKFIETPKIDGIE